MSLADAGDRESDQQTRTPPLPSDVAVGWLCVPAALQTVKGLVHPDAGMPVESSLLAKTSPEFTYTTNAPPEPSATTWAWTPAPQSNPVAGHAGSRPPPESTCCSRT